MLDHEALLGRMDIVVDMAGVVVVVVVDLEARGVAMVAVDADPWAPGLHLETGDVVRGPMPTVAEVEAASEVEEVVTRDLSCRHFENVTCWLRDENE